MPELLSEIRTPRLRLRPPNLADASAVFTAYGADPEVVRFMPWSAHQTVDESEAYLQARLEWCQQGTHQYWLITTDTQVRGMIGTHTVDHAVEVGFILGQASWGRGFATEALQAILNLELGQPGIYRVWGYCDVDNLASARVMEKVGMTREGLLRRYARFTASDEPRDVYVYAATR